jgi:hypothetical protein
MLQLIATPEKFDGKLVAVIGFLSLEPEGCAIYPNKEDYENVILENALWLDVPESMLKDREKLELKYVRIEGTFRAGHEKRNWFSAGGITSIVSSRFWSDPAHPLEGRIRSMLP